MQSEHPTGRHSQMPALPGAQGATPVQGLHPLRGLHPQAGKGHLHDYSDQVEPMRQTLKPLA
eukprot:3964788-Amphidinium_carterae.1